MVHRELLYLFACSFQAALTIGKIDALHDARDGVLRCLDKQMHMVAHQNIGVKDKAGLLFIAPESIEIFVSVLIVQKDILSPVAAHDDVVKCARILYAGLARHIVQSISCLFSYYQA